MRYNSPMKFPEPNTLKLLILSTLQALTFYAAFEKIFFQENGLSLFEIALLTAIFSVFVIVLEVPSGALSDRWKRKYVLLLSILASIATLLFFVTGTGFIQFAVGTVFASIAFVLNSGTNNSILFDSLKEFNAVESFEKYLALRRILSGIGFALASLAGGWIADYHGISFAMWSTLMFLIPAVFITLSLREPQFHKTTGEMTYFKHIKSTAQHLTSNSYFIQVIVLSVTIMTINILIEDYSQLYYYAVGFSLLAIGLLSFFEGVKESFSNYIGALLPQRKNLPVIFGFLLLLMAGSLFVTAWQPNIVGVAGLFLTSAIFFIIDVPLLGNFHKKLSSGTRATSESFLNLVTELSKVIVAIGFGVVANLYSIYFAFGVLGVLVLFYTIYYWIFAFRVFSSSFSSEQS